MNGDNPTQTELIDYEQFCGLNVTERNEKKQVKEITVEELYKLQVNGEPYQLIDVREPYEYEIANLDGELVPLNTIDSYADQIQKDKKVVIHCRSGKRSADAIEHLEQEYGFTNLYNLKGGILEYSKKVDNTLAEY